MLPNLVLCASLLSLPTRCAAQQTLLPTPHYYVGLGASLLTSRPFHTPYEGPTLVGPALTIGRHFTPRVALQATVAWQAGGQRFRSSASTAAVLLRYSVLSSAARLQLAGIGGVTWQNYGWLASQSESNSRTYTNFTLGPAVQYALTAHVALAASVPVLLLLDRTDSRALSTHLSLNPQVGVTYAFGR
jgi:opacity protein-like surface antigen